MGFILRSLLVIGTFLALVVLWSSLTPKPQEESPFGKRVSGQRQPSHIPTEGATPPSCPWLLAYLRPPDGHGQGVFTPRPGQHRTRENLLLGSSASFAGYTGCHGD